jgi:hypothetical protein
MTRQEFAKKYNLEFVEDRDIFMTIVSNLSDLQINSNHEQINNLKELIWDFEDVLLYEKQNL